MADSKISALTATTSLGDTDELAVASAGASKKITGANLKASVIADATNATQAELDAHEADTTNIHGISDTSALLTSSAAAAAYQPLDATLTALAGANWASNALPIGTGSDALSQTSFAANTFPARASIGNLVAKTITDFGLSLVDDADAATAKATLGLDSVGFPIFAPSSGAIVRVPYFSARPGGSTILITDQTCFYIPFVVLQAVTLTAIWVNVTTIGGSGAVVRLGVMNDSGGLPGTVKLDAGTVATTGTGNKGVTSLGHAVSPGRYWVAVVGQGAPSPSTTLASVAGSEFEAVPWPSGTSIGVPIGSGTTSPIVALTQTGVSGSLGTASPSGSAAGQGAACPIVGLVF